MNGRAQRSRVACRITHELNVRAERQNLATVFGAQAGKRPFSVSLGPRQAVSLPHAEGMVDRQDNQLASTRRSYRRGVHKRSREGECQQDQQRRAQREQQQVTQAAVLDRAVGPPFEKHQGAEG